MILRRWVLKKRSATAMHEVVDNLDAEDQAAPPPLPFNQRFVVAQAEGRLEAKRKVARIDHRLALCTG